MCMTFGNKTTEFHVSLWNFQVFLFVRKLTKNVLANDFLFSVLSAVSGIKLKITELHDSGLSSSLSYTNN